MSIDIKTAIKMGDTETTTRGYTPHRRKRTFVPSGIKIDHENAKASERAIPIYDMPTKGLIYAKTESEWINSLARDYAPAIKEFLSKQPTMMFDKNEIANGIHFIIVDVHDKKEWNATLKQVAKDLNLNIKTISTPCRIEEVDEETEEVTVRTIFVTETYYGVGK